MMEASSRHDGVEVGCHACFLECHAHAPSLELAVNELPCSREMLWDEFRRMMEQADG